MILFTRCEKWNTSIDVNNWLVLKPLFRETFIHERNGNVGEFGG